jgi:hypothetical protein
METVKVDIQKLQLLNDRIAQTLEALNLLRMSVHGIQHTQAISPWGYGVGTLPYQVQPGFGASPYVPYPTTSFGYPQYASPFASSFVPGIQHTQTQQWGYPQTQWGYPQTQWGYPQTQVGYPQTQLANQLANPFTSFVPGIQHTQSTQPTWTQQTGWNTPTGWTTPWQTQMSNGISHSAWEPTWQMRQWTWPQMW